MTEHTSPNLAHFAINADDVEASRAFYEDAFGWRFAAWGPPGFYRIHTGDDTHPGVEGALQQRRELAPGSRITGLECTFAVPDVDAFAQRARAAGGTVLMPRFTIAGVGHLVFVADPSGNPVGAMQYDADAE
ncbi:VOC family protein [Nakamurella sp.]|uniref:VOC family protein n=1 Tax=Nakamurella sp. TaxID=1869182 RepID=UPI0037852997